MPVVCAVVPACNEEAHIDACLRALDAARAALSESRQDWRGRTVVVLDACTDATAALAAAHVGVQTVAVEARCVGAARAAGAAVALETDPRSASHTGPADWLACTDADSTVPESWFLDQVSAAEAGWAARVGTVTPLLGADLSSEQAQRWAAQHTLGPGHPHVFGANLGISARAYRAVGGFAPLHVGEDVDIVARIRAGGLAVQATAEAPVTTSARPRSRVAGGFASYLARLSAE